MRTSPTPRRSSGSRDARIDAYIGKSAEFARPLLIRLRELVHEACPDVTETIKWGMPSFEYAGAILCGMAAFKRHVSFGYWKHALVVGAERARDGMGSYGRMATPQDLPPQRTLLAHIRKAAALNARGVTSGAKRTGTRPRPSPRAPSDLVAALRRNRQAQATFAAFAPSARREYVEWIIEAKRPATRARRLDQAVAWMAEGKRRNWKYEA